MLSKQINVSVTPEKYAWLKKQAENLNISLSNFIKIKVFSEVNLKD